MKLSLRPVLPNLLKLFEFLIFVLIICQKEEQKCTHSELDIYKRDNQTYLLSSRRDIDDFHLKNCDSNVKEKGRDLTQSYDKKTPLHPQTIPKGNLTTQKRHQKFDYTLIADRLRTVSWSNNSHPTGVAKPIYGIPTFPLTTKAVWSKGHTIKQLMHCLIFRNNNIQRRDIEGKSMIVYCDYSWDPDSF